MQQQQRLVVIVFVWMTVAVIVESADHGVVTLVDNNYWGCCYDVAVVVGRCGGDSTENGIVYEHD